MRIGAKNHLYVSRALKFRIVPQQLKDRYETEWRVSDKVFTSTFSRLPIILTQGGWSWTK